jgi:hypothetical protein
MCLIKYPINVLSLKMNEFANKIIRAFILLNLTKCIARLLENRMRDGSCLLTFHVNVCIRGANYNLPRI